MQNSLRLRLGATALVAIALVFSACGSSTTAVTSGATPVKCPATSTLAGTGSSFDNPLFQKMFVEFPKVTCGLNASYTSTGSGAGKSQLLAQTVDFGATDGPMTDTELAQSTNGPILHIPVTLGAVVMAYNLAGVTKLTFSGDLIAQIFLGKITKWNDPAIAALNAGVSLPATAITVAHRSDGSGTTAIFTDYLAKVSPDWANGPKAGSTVNWPVGVGGKGNDGVTAAVKQTDGALGYVELTYALANNISFANVQNSSNKAIAPSLDSVKAAAGAFTNIPDDLRFYVTNTPAADGYPISGFSWVIVYQNQKDADKGQAIANLLWWMTHDGQFYSTALFYVPLPAAIVTKVEGKINALTCGSSKCYNGTYTKGK